MDDEPRRTRNKDIATIVYLVAPLNVPVRLEVVTGLTGVPAATIRDAIIKRELRGVKHKSAWLIYLEDFTGWIESQGQKLEPKEQGVSVREKRERRVSSADQNGSEPEVPSSRPARKKRCKPGKRVVVYNLRPGMARD